MAVVTYDITYDHGSPTQEVTITVTMRTGTIIPAPGETIPTNTIEYSIDGGSVASLAGVLDEDVPKETFKIIATLNAMIDGTPNTSVDTALIGAGFTKTIT